MTGVLFDENLPTVSGLPTTFPIIHAIDLGSRMSDSALWDYAKQHDLAILTKDADFSQRIILASPPPRVIHLRVGNLRRREFEEWLKQHWPGIETAIKQHKLVNVYPARIQSVR